VALVVSYHPTIFKHLSSLTLSNPLQASLLNLAAAGVSVYSPHTALDSMHGGINDWLARCAGTLEDAHGDSTLPSSVIVSLLGEPRGNDEGGLGRLLTLPDPLSIEELVGRIKKHLRLSHVDVGRPLVRRKVRTVAICAGSGASVLNGVDADVYFTGEMAHHDVLAAVAAGRYAVLCGHTNTERGYLPILASKLSSTLTEFANGGDPSSLSSHGEAVPQTTSTSGPHGASPSISGPGLTEQERQALRNVEVFVSEADTDPLERM